MRSELTHPTPRRKSNWPFLVLLAILAPLLVVLLSPSAFEFVQETLLRFGISSDAFQELRVEKENERLAKELSERSVDTESPVYRFATSPAWNGGELLQCDGTPNVSAAGARGYLIVARWRAPRSYLEPTDAEGLQRTMPKMNYRELVLFPSGTVSAVKLKRALASKRYLSHRPQRIYYLGDGEGYSWFADENGGRSARLQKDFDLKGGDDLWFEWDKNLATIETRTDRQGLLYTAGTTYGEQAIPRLMKLIEHPIEDSDRLYATCGLAGIPGPRTTELLLSIYDRYDCTKKAGCGMVPYALINYEPREGAKRVYLDMLSRDTEENYYFRAVEASLRFRWTEAAPLLRVQMVHPYGVGTYARLFESARDLEGNPVPKEISKIEEAIYINAARQNGLGREELVQRLLNCGDSEAIIIEAVFLATVTGKIVGQEWVNNCGKNALRQMPTALVFPILDHLAQTTRREHDRESVVGLLAFLKQTPRE